MININGKRLIDLRFPLLRKPLIFLFFCIISVWIVFFLTGCTTHVRPAPTVSLLEIRQENVVAQQWDMSCGAAALATILTYQHNHPISEKQIAEAMLRRTDPLKVKVKGGFSLLDLKHFVENHGFKGDGYTKLTLRHLNAMGPTIVPLYLDGYNHFVVFRGMLGSKVLLADSGFGNRTLDKDTFEKAWLQNIGFVVRRLDNTPAPNRLSLQPTDFAQVSNSAIRHALQ